MHEKIKHRQGGGEEVQSAPENRVRRALHIDVNRGGGRISLTRRRKWWSFRGFLDSSQSQRAASATQVRRRQGTHQGEAASPCCLSPLACRRHPGFQAETEQDPAAADAAGRAWAKTEAVVGKTQKRLQKELNLGRVAWISKSERQRAE